MARAEDAEEGLDVRGAGADLEDVQNAINKSALAVLKCSKALFDWNQDAVPEAQRRTFFDSLSSASGLAMGET